MKKSIHIVAQANVFENHSFAGYTAHKVTRESADRIAAALNENQYMQTDNPDITWKVFKITEESPVYRFASKQAFIIRSGYLYEKDY